MNSLRRIKRFAKLLRKFIATVEVAIKAMELRQILEARRKTLLAGATVDPKALALINDSYEKAERGERKADVAMSNALNAVRLDYCSGIHGELGQGFGFGPEMNIGWAMDSARAWLDRFGL